MSRPPMSRPGLLLLAALGLLLAARAAAQTRYLAFGDSITAGVGDDPARPPEEQGYPPRLEALLDGADLPAAVANHGLGGERTPEGLTRIDEVLAGGGDVLLLMEGTNDISRSISREATLFNLGEMARKAEALGFEVVMATLLPRIPTANVDPENWINQATCEAIRDLAGRSERRLVDPFEVFTALPNRFAEVYWDDPVDGVGHPNAAGYDVMAAAFFDVLASIDSVPPVTGIISPANGAAGVSRNAVIDVEVWDFGAGIELANTALLVDGEETGAIPQGGSRRASLRWEPPQPLSGVVRVSLRSQDRVVPPNAVEREIARFVVAGSTFLEGDLDRDGRVDGIDLVRLGLVFGAEAGDGRYQSVADLNGDGIIDGVDLARMASNFGRSSS